MDPNRCPLCGGDNRCGAVAGTTDCWCMSATIPAAVLERVPPAQQGVVCVCARCAAGSAAASESDAPQS